MIRVFWLIPVLLLATIGILLLSMHLGMGQSGNFKVPDAAAREAAIGDTRLLDSAVQRTYSSSSEFFEPIDKPRGSDWLANHREPGQTFVQFLRSRRNRPDKKRKVIYLQPVGEFGKDAPSLDALQKYSTAYFQMEVKMLEPITAESLEAKKRINSGTGKEQILAGDVMEGIKKKLPKDAYCMLAITMIDLYPQESWNFVFGMASLSERVGVFSFARYDPEFYGQERDEGSKALALRRSAKVLVHETGHMFGIRHCIHFNCIMNGSNHLEETDNRPMHLCPVCLRKLQNSIQFDPAKRYRQLDQRYGDMDFKDEADWVKRRMKAITAS